MASCKDCLHYDVCASIEGLVMRVILSGDKANERCGLFKPKADLVEVKHFAHKLATALVKADVDCIKICNNFGGGCYWSCSETEKVDYIKQWIIEVIENG